MSYEEPLSKQAVAISISESPDLRVLGLGEEHLIDCMAEVARHLLAMGARLMYGGDLRPSGFSEILFELIARYRRDSDVDDERVGVTNFLAWPVHVSLSSNELKRLSESLTGVAEVICLTMTGEVIPLADRFQLSSCVPSDSEWRDGLTAMRETMAKMADARVILGGKTDRFKGQMPGIAEEALVTLRTSKPLFVVGGFGGCASDIAEELNLVSDQSKQHRTWAGRTDFAGFSINDLNNGLDAQENSTLASTVHIDQAATLILRGLLRKQ